MVFTLVFLVVFYRVTDTHVETIHEQLFVIILLSSAPVECFEGQFFEDFRVELLFFRMLRE